MPVITFLYCNRKCVLEKNMVKWNGRKWEIKKLFKVFPHHSWAHYWFTNICYIMSPRFLFNDCRIYLHVHLVREIVYHLLLLFQNIPNMNKFRWIPTFYLIYIGVIMFYNTSKSSEMKQDISSSAVNVSF